MFTSYPAQHPPGAPGGVSVSAALQSADTAVVPTPPVARPAPRHLVWANLSLRRHILEYLPPTKQAAALLLNKETFEIGVMVLYREWEYREKVLIQVQDRERLRSYCNAVRQLVAVEADINGCVAHLKYVTREDVFSPFRLTLLLTTFPCLDTLNVLFAVDNETVLWLDVRGKTARLHAELKGICRMRATLGPDWEVIRGTKLMRHKSIEDTIAAISTWADPKGLDDGAGGRGHRGGQFVVCAEDMRFDDFVDDFGATPPLFWELEFCDFGDAVLLRSVFEALQSSPCRLRLWRLCVSFTTRVQLAVPRAHHLCDPDFQRSARLVPVVCIESFRACPFDASSADFFAGQPRWTDAPTSSLIHQLRIAISMDGDRETALPLHFPAVSDMANALLNVGGAACHYEFEYKVGGTAIKALSEMIGLEIKRAINAVRRDRQPGWRKLEREGVVLVMEANEV